MAFVPKARCVVSIPYCLRSFSGAIRGFFCAYFVTINVLGYSAARSCVFFVPKRLLLLRKRYFSAQLLNNRVVLVWIVIRGV